MRKPSDSGVDWFVLLGGTAFLVLIVAPIVVAPERSSVFIDQAFKFLTTQFGVYYIIAACAIFLFLLAVALGRHGNHYLGPADKPPKHSGFSWAAMLFCTGIGSSLIYWGAVEWAFYYNAPPFGIEPQSESAILWASSYGMFNWGPVAWGFYCLPAVAFCCSYHLHGIPVLRLSAACRGILGDLADQWPGRLIDLMFLVGLLATAATGLAFGTSLVSSAFTRLTGMEDGFAMQAVIISLATSLIAYSVYRGLEKGIKVLSVINIILAMILVLFVLIVGPTRFILEMGVASVGIVVQNFFRMITWSDPLEQSNFVESWTIFYWAWWLALGPFVGMFVAKISRGRTLRQVIFGMLGWGSLGCAVFFIVLGNYALHLELNHVLEVVHQTTTESPSAAIASIIEILPMGQFWLAFLAVIGIIFAATTYDSAAYALAAGTTLQLPSDEDPSRKLRVYWAVLLGILPLTLLYVGGLTSVQTASIVASVPLLPIYFLMAWSIVRMLKAKPGQLGLGKA
jgi:BCCT family betaine/carnitine transporter